jgi:hypothetical protein
MADQHEVDLDSIIDRLLEVRGSRPGKQVQLLEAEIRYLCTKAREIFISQPILLELEAPIKVSLALQRLLHFARVYQSNVLPCPVTDLWRYPRSIL